jgi:hypothetical protein
LAYIYFEDESGRRSAAKLLSSDEARRVISLLSRTYGRQDWGKRAVNLLKDTFPMKTAAEYRAMAEECFKWAREAQTREVRVSYRQLAQVWLDTASNLELTRPDKPSKAAGSAD